MKTTLLALAGGWLLWVAVAANVSAQPLSTLILDGQNNHNWKMTTPLLKKILEESGRFTVEVATAPARGQGIASYKPNFAAYKVIVSNYNGEMWSPETQEAFVQYVRGGGGFVVVHAANNSFPQWKEYNEIIGLGGWGGRNEKSGPYLRLREGRFVPDHTPGSGGHHGPQHAFAIDIRVPDHPITRGLPARWMHAQDELYDRLRGPALNVTVLASAYADPKQRGSGEHEPMLFTIQYGQGRVFHTVLGHGAEGIRCVGFTVTLQRGTEWAATGQVTQPVPANFPTADQVVSW